MGELFGNYLTNFMEKKGKGNFVSSFGMIFFSRIYGV
jgi:hypothetical protein